MALTPPARPTAGPPGPHTCASCGTTFQVIRRGSASPLRCPACGATITPDPGGPSAAIRVPGSGTGAFSSSAAEVERTGHQLVRELGRGGMGIVYLATEPETDREVAVKFLSRRHGAGEELGAESNIQRRFLREARLTASLQHPGVVPIYRVGGLGNGETPWYTMSPVVPFEWIAGGGIVTGVRSVLQ